jgi:hypothetical protein
MSQHRLTVFTVITDTLRFPDDRVEPVMDCFVTCPVAQPDAVKFMENLAIDIDELVGKALQQIDGFLSSTLLKIILQGRIKGRCWCQQRPDYRLWISSLIVNGYLRHPDGVHEYPGKTHFLFCTGRTTTFNSVSRNSSGI